MGGLDIVSIRNIQNKVGALRLKNQNNISVVQNKTMESQFYEIPEWFNDIDMRSDEEGLVNFIYELINCGTDNR